MTPALCAVFGMLLSLLLFHEQPELNGITCSVSVTLLVLTIGLGTKLILHPSNPSHTLVFAMCLGACLGWNNTWWQAQTRLHNQLLFQCESIPLQADILIAELPNVTDSGTKWVGQVQSFTPTDQCPRIPPRLIMGWYNHASNKPPPIIIGDVWRLNITLKRTVAPLSFDGFDVQAYWFANQIGATGSVISKQSHQAQLLEHVVTPGTLIEQARAIYRQHIQDTLRDAPYAGVMVALILGDQKAITPDQWRVFSATGIGHLVSISGMHITLFATIAAWLVLRLWKQSAKLCYWIPAHQVAALVGFLFAFAYSLLAGWGLPAQRTVWMLCGVLLGILIQSKPGAVHILNFSAGLLMLMDPWCVLSAGFWLSFGAVALLMYSSVGRFHLTKLRWLKVRQALYAQLVVTIGLIPLSCFMFYQLSWISPLANSFAIAWVSFIVTPLAMLGVFAGMDWPLLWAHQCFEWLMWVLTPMSQWSWATTPMAKQPLGIYAISVVGVLWILAPRGTPLKLMGWCLLTSLWWWPVSKPSHGDVWLDVLDIGQGNAVAIQTRQHVLIYDTGPAPNPQADSGLRVVIPWLNQHGVSHPDGLMVSHQDNDHSGGASSVLQLTSPKWFSSSIDNKHPLIQQAQNQGIKNIPCREGQHWEWDGVRFDVVFPRDIDFQIWHETNDTCCVLKISTREHSALLMGDIGIAQEQALVERYAEQLKTDVMLVPHHGSKTSSSELLLDTTQPAIAIFQVGYKNRYQHPKPDIVRRYEARGIQNLRTDQTGAIKVFLDNHRNITWTTSKHTQQKYWHVNALATQAINAAP